MTPIREAMPALMARNRRVLWMLNHRTLLPFEAPMLERLGFEVFVPKIHPASGFRSASVDWTFDQRLTIPQRALELLNSFDFYDQPWDRRVTATLNRYFGTIFVMPHGRIVGEAVDNFEGQVVLRAFGLANSENYGEVLTEVADQSVLNKIEAIGPRFWFGEAYDNLHEIEPAVIASRAVYLPIGLPETAFAHADTWSGVEPTVLMVCPDINVSPYYRTLYEDFKEHLGDLPHVIVGAQSTPVDDPNVVGFVEDDALIELYQSCRLMYYPSVELRHVHYSPIEAAVVGMPVVFRSGSLLDRLSGGTVGGRAESLADARRLVEQLLADDAETIATVRADQHRMVEQFAVEHCTTTWSAQMEASGLAAALGVRSRSRTLLREGWRQVVSPASSGRVSVRRPFRELSRPLRTTRSVADAAAQLGCSLADGIDFSARVYPDFVHFVHGLHMTEGWGRWSRSDVVEIALRHNIGGQFRLLLRAAAYGRNVGAPVSIRVGSETRIARLGGDVNAPMPTWLHFDVRRPTSVIHLRVPFPQRPPTDPRTLGVGLVELRWAPAVTLGLEQARAVLGSSLYEGIDFTAAGTAAPFVESMNGLYDAEPWGRWSCGDRVHIELRHTLVGRIRLRLRAVGYGPNDGAFARVLIDRQDRRFRLGDASGPDDELTIDFDLPTPSNVIEFRVPHPTEPPGDPRTVGIGFVHLRCESRH